MYKEDFNRLKEICEKEGFEVLNDSPEDNEKYVIIKKAKKTEKFYVFYAGGTTFINSDYMDPECPGYSFDFKLPIFTEIDHPEVGTFLAKKMEEYLNKKSGG